MDALLESIAKFIQRIRPKTYNFLARSIVGLGVVLVAESQFGILKIIALATYEGIFGPSEILRSYLTTNSNPWFGIFLIVIGLIYHYLMTVGKEQIDLRLAAIPKQPELNFKLFNSDMEPFEGDAITMRGVIVSVPKDENIPEYIVNYDNPHTVRLNSILNAVRGAINNNQYYKERAELLKVWGGAELLTLCIENNSPVLATGVSVDITIPRAKGISADNTNEAKPSLPSAERESQYAGIAHLITKSTPHYDIKSSHKNNEYYFNWVVDDIQANTSLYSNTFIYLRSEVDFDFTITIYCDQFERPLTKKIKVLRKNPTLTITNSDLTSTDVVFSKLVDKCVMDGYIMRVMKNKLDEYEHSRQEIIP